MTSKFSAESKARPAWRAWVLTMGVCAGWTASAAAAPEPSIDADYSAGMLDPAAAIAAAQAIRAEEYPNSDDVLVDSLQRVFYRPDGTSVTWDEFYYKILTEKGRREGRSLAFSFNETYGSLRLLALEVIGADGSRHPIDIPSHSRVIVDPSSMDENIYDPHDKRLQAVIPELGIGETVHVLLQQTETKTRVPDTWSDFAVLEHPSPIRHLTYEVYAPRERPLRSLALKGEVPGTVVATTRPWTGGTLHRWDVHDVPRFFEEPAMPDAYMIVQRLLVSTLPDWPTVSRWYWKLSEPHLAAVTPEMRRKTEDLIAGCATPRDKVAALFKFVSQQIRYMGVTAETEAPGYEPHDASLTFANRYGVCRDKAALLVALLRLAGFEAFPVLIHAGPKKDEEVPAPFFNHAIAAVRLDGAYQLMDPTDETTRELLPPYLGDKSYLVATPEGDPLRTSPIVPADKNLVRIRTEGELTDDGRLVARSVLDFDGINDNVYRGFFASLKPEQRRRMFEGLLKALMPGARLTAFQIEPSDMQDSSRALRVTLAFEADDAVIGGRRASLLPTPWFGSAVGLVNYLEEAMGLEKRRFPLRTDVTCGVREDLRLTLGRAVGDALSMPDTTDLDTPTLRWSRHMAMDGRVLTGHSELLFRTVEFSPAEYLDLKRALRTIEADHRKKPVFAPGEPARPAAPPPAAAQAADSADAEIERMTRVVTIHDAHAWEEITTVRKRIRTYAGVKDHSEVKLAYNPAWEEVELLDASVVTAAGETRAVTPKEINLMDAPWNGEAPRYPGGKTLVVSLPGVEVGAVLEYRVRRRTQGRPFFADSAWFGGSSPVTEQTLTLDATETLALRTSVTHGEVLRMETARAGDRVRYTWCATNLPPVTAERSLPPPWVTRPTVHVSAGDWRGYARDLHARMDAAAQPGPLARRLAAEAVTGKSNELDRVRALRDLAALRLRDAGPTFTELPLSTLTPADTTLEDGYGHDADRAIALAALLRAAGFQPEFILAAADPECDDVLAPFRRQAEPGFFFTAPLVRVRAGGETLVLNDTDQYAELGATPHDGCPALELPSGRIRAIAAPDALRNRGLTQYDLRLEPDGTARIEVTVWHRGDDYGEFRRTYRELPPEERRRRHEEMLSALSQNAVADGPLVTDTETYPGRETFAARVERYAVRDGRRLYFQLPDGADPLPGLSTDARVNPLYWDMKQETRTEMTIHLPPGFREAELLPPDLDLRAPGGAARVTSRTQWRPEASGGARLTLTRDTRIEPAVLPAQDYPALLELDRRLLHRRMTMVMVSEE